MRVAVIGAGAAGCAAAHTLASDHHAVVVFEREPFAGGRTHTVRCPDGVVVDTGAGFFTQYYPLLWRFIADLGLEPDVVELSHTAGLVRDGKLAKLRLGSPGSFARFPYAGPIDKLRMAMVVAAQYARRGSIDLVEPATLARWDTASIASLRGRIGSRAFDALVRPSIEPFWYADCAELSLALALGLHSRFATTRFFTLRRGMDTLCRALIDRCATRLSTPVTSLRAGRDGVVDLEAADAHSGSIAERFDAVIVATTANVAAALTADLPASWVSDEQRAFLDTQRYAPNAHLTYLARQVPVLADLSLVSQCEAARHPIAAVGFHAQKYPGAAFRDRGDEIVSVYSADFAVARLMAEGAAMGHAAWTLARDVCPPLPAEARLIHTAIREQAAPIHEVGRYRRAASFVAAQRAPVVFAGDYLATATVEGALRSGVHAANRLLQA